MFGCNDKSDRMTFSLFLDLLSNQILPHHRRLVPDGPLLWVLDAPTCHGVS